MTREEAIEILRQFKTCLSDVVFDEKGSEAWQMAIQALSQEPCDDAISRKKAIYVISACDGKSAQIEALEQLPSVTQKSGKWDRSCTCSVCGQWRILESEKNSGKYKFCPNCGSYNGGDNNGNE